jgi:succinoglycan biosynthesis protein ExoW
MVRIGVVVPFYQRQAGLLRKSLASVLGQDLPDHAHLVIVVVDDESPFPPDGDLATLGDLGQHELVQLFQSNGGPGAARNAGLDYLAKHPVDFIAFIDSDDIWLPDHLTTALDALGNDGDFFFADHYRESFNTGKSYFEGNPLVQQWLCSTSTGPLQVTPIADVFEVCKQYQLNVFLEDYLAQTATVVYRQDRLGHIRFDSRLRISGEDYLFWLYLAREARVIRFKNKVAVLCQEGVNIYHSTLDWNHPNAPARYAYQLMLWRHVNRDFDLTAEQKAMTASKAVEFSRGFSYLWARSLAKTGRHNWQLVTMLKTQAHWPSVQIVPGLIGAIYRKLRGRPLFPEH